jgi:hypothetical protein
MLRKSEQECACSVKGEKNMKRLLLIIAMLGLAATLGNSALAQDHFRCYPFASPQTLTTTFQLQDQFDVARGTLETINQLTSVRFCNPLEKIVNGVITPNFNPTHHLTMYQINPQPIITRTVTVRNQFGTQTLTTTAATTLAVPTGKSRPPAAPPPPATDCFDHYKCYTASGPSLVNISATLTDQFRTDTVQVMQPVIFCNPVKKIRNGVTTPITKPTVHLVCYSKTVVPFQATINIRNQFVTTNNVVVENPDLLCVPSLKLSWH